MTADIEGDMRFREDFPPERLRERSYPKAGRAKDDRPRLRNGAGANRITAVLLNALAIGAISAAFIAPDGSFSQFTGLFTPNDGARHVFPGWQVTLSGETHGLKGPELLKLVEPILPYFYLFIGFVLHLAAREVAKRS